jgi:hypothetical protein
MTVSIGDMHRQIVTLADQHGFAIRWGRRARAFRIGSGEIEIWPILSWFEYAAALHEIGHLLGRYQGSRNSASFSREGRRLSRFSMLPSTRWGVWNAELSDQ